MMEQIKLCSSLLLLAFLFACSPATKNSERNVQLIEKYIQSVENLDYETMQMLLAEDYIGYGPSYRDSITKKQAIVNWKYLVSHMYSKIEYNRSRNIAVSVSDGENKGDWVSNWAELNITYKNESSPVTIWANTIYRIENEKITRSYTFYNEADVLRQMNYSFIKQK
jgi:hypothetical protein